MTSGQKFRAAFMFIVNELSGRHLACVGSASVGQSQELIVMPIILIPWFLSSLQQFSKIS